MLRATARNASCRAEAFASLARTLESSRSPGDWLRPVRLALAEFLVGGELSASTGWLLPLVALKTCSLLCRDAVSVNSERVTGVADGEDGGAGGASGKAGAGAAVWGPWPGAML